MASLQRVVQGDVLLGTKVIVDNPGAADFGDRGIIHRRSRSENHCWAVEFDNEKGVLSQVYDDEISAVKAEGMQQVPPFFRPAKYTITAKKNGVNVVIIGEIDISTTGSGDAIFEASYQGQKAGDLSVEHYGNGIMLLTGLHTFKVKNGQRIAGLGAVLMKVAAFMAQLFGTEAIKIAATKSPEEPHPAPYYASFGAATNDALAAYSNDLALYIASRNNQPVNMTVATDILSDNTGGYVSEKGWTYEHWRPQ